MKELIEYIAKSIVNKPEAVVVTEEQSSERLILKLQVDPEDTGRVIGKQGRVAQAMRTLLRVMAVREGIRANLEIVSDQEIVSEAETSHETSE
ncbi:MAG: KH domain-containing protein [Dehalococcoidia bacterium]|nr:KH domain-containing protein [Dehalococcoidia bacterium]